MPCTMPSARPRPVQPRLPILIGGSGPTKTLRTTARYADLWNGYGTPELIAATSDILRERCAEIGRPFDEIGRTVTLDAVIRDSDEEAHDTWADTVRANGLEDQSGADGSDRGLSLGGPPASAATLIAEYESIGIREVIFMFRAPFDLETIGRLAEVRAIAG